jgi:hypothetical protein
LYLTFRRDTTGRGCPTENLSRASSLVYGRARSPAGRAPSHEEPINLRRECRRIERIRPHCGQSRARSISVDFAGKAGMWWLQFAEGGAAIVAATSATQARLIAVIHGFGRASTLVEAYAIDADFLQFIPDNLIGKKLSTIEVDEVMRRLKLATRHFASRAS